MCTRAHRGQIPVTARIASLSALNSARPARDKLFTLRAPPSRDDLLATSAQSLTPTVLPAWQHTHSHTAESVANACTRLPSFVPAPSFVSAPSPVLAPSPVRVANPSILAKLADRAASLAEVADRATPFAELADRATPLGELADRAAPLAELADHPAPLAKLTDRAAPLGELVVAVAL